MKKEYMAPLATTITLQTEGLLARSMEIGDDEITNRDNIGTQRKRSWGKSSPWETEEE